MVKRLTYWLKETGQVDVEESEQDRDSAQRGSDAGAIAHRGEPPPRGEFHLDRPHQYNCSHLREYVVRTTGAMEGGRETGKNNRQDMHKYQQMRNALTTPAPSPAPYLERTATPEEEGKKKKEAEIKQQQ